MFRKKITPICIHDWRLVDTRIADVFNGVDIDIERMYTVGCPNCNLRRELDEYEYSHFQRTFKIGEGER